MGIAELEQNQLIIYSTICTYGQAAEPSITNYISQEIEMMWNECRAIVRISGRPVAVRFVITPLYSKELRPEAVMSNDDPSMNYFRIEPKASGNISFVDGLGSNTGYFQFDNLYEGSTTAAHEYGHTLGLPHPDDLDLRGKGVPGIMYPRGTIVDAPYQYNPQAYAGDSSNGGTMHPKNRRVLQSDIADLQLNRLLFKNGKAIVGDFSSIWHEAHIAF